MWRICTLILALGAVGCGLTAMSASPPVASDTGSLETISGVGDVPLWSKLSNAEQDVGFDFGQAIPTDDDSSDVLGNESLVLDSSAQLAHEAQYGGLLHSPLELVPSQCSLVSQHVRLQI